MSEATTAARPSKEELEDVLKNVIDPELGVNIVDLGLLYGMRWSDEGALILDMTLTTAACPLQDVIEEQVATSLLDVVTGHTLNWVWMPPWGPQMITDEGREQLRALGFNV